MKVKAFLFFFLFTSFSVFASEAQVDLITQTPDGIIEQTTIPETDDVLEQITEHKSAVTQLPQELRVISWNVHKGSDKEAWADDLLHLSQTADVIGLQEGMDDDFMPDILRQLTDFSFFMARSFYNEDGSSTGVLTGAVAAPVKIDFRRSPGREPILNTPKMTLLTTYKMEDGVPVLVLNVHGINFVLNGHLRDQLEALRSSIYNWTGRVILMGDFNTWNIGRKKILSNFAESLNLQEVSFDSQQSPDPRNMKLDHVFVRGCIPVEAKVLGEIRTSDHYPLYIKMNCQ